MKIYWIYVTFDAQKAGYTPNRKALIIEAVVIAQDETGLVKLITPPICGEEAPLDVQVRDLGLAHPIEAAGIVTSHWSVV